MTSSSPLSDLPDAPSYTAFDGVRRLATGSPAMAVLAAAAALRSAAVGPVFVFDDATGEAIDFNPRHSDAELLARFPAAPSAEPSDTVNADAPRGRGRPKLGVVAREVTLLPRHWEWLAAQPGGASVALRKLVDTARHAHAERDRARAARDAAYHFMSAMAGNLVGFEEASRALFAGDRWRFREQTAEWPVDVREHAIRLAFGASDAAPAY